MRIKLKPVKPGNWWMTWHKHFLLRPRIVEDSLVWLEYVERRGKQELTWVYAFGRDQPVYHTTWEYKLIPPTYDPTFKKETNDSSKR